METAPIISMGDLPEYLMYTAVVAPVFIWGPPGVGKSAVVEQFAASVGLECVSLLGSQLAPEDLIGVPRIEGKHSVFCPPRQIARDKPYVLFLDELNACTPDVQKAFYSLIHDRRLGEYELPEGSIIIGAGNRATDSAIVRQMSSALINRLVHVGVKADSDAWLAWAANEGIHPLIYEYIKQHPSHLHRNPPKEERTYSTPRSWHLLSRLFQSYPEELLTTEIMATLAGGALSPHDATTFIVFCKNHEQRFLLNKILKGEARWPRKAEQRDLLHYLTLNFRDQLIKSLPQNANKLSKSEQDLSYNATRLLAELADIAGDLAQMVIVPDENGNALPDWFMAEIAGKLPVLVRK